MQQIKLYTSLYITSRFVKYVPDPISIQIK